MVSYLRLSGEWPSSTMTLDGRNEIHLMQEDISTKWPNALDFEFRLHLIIS